MWNIVLIVKYQGSQFLLVRISVASRYPPRDLAPLAMKCERQFRGEFSETGPKNTNRRRGSLQISAP
jgi:hypothetical protein